MFLCLKGHSSSQLDFLSPSEGEGEQTETCCCLWVVCFVWSLGPDHNSNPHLTKQKSWCISGLCQRHPLQSLNSLTQGKKTCCFQNLWNLCKTSCSVSRVHITRGSVEQSCLQPFTVGTKASALTEIACWSGENYILLLSWIQEMSRFLSWYRVYLKGKCCKFYHVRSVHINSCGF